MRFRFEPFGGVVELHPGATGTFIVPTELAGGIEFTIRASEVIVFVPEADTMVETEAP